MEGMAGLSTERSRPSRRGFGLGDRKCHGSRQSRRGTSVRGHRTIKEDSGSCHSDSRSRAGTQVPVEVRLLLNRSALFLPVGPSGEEETGSVDLITLRVRKRWEIPGCGFVGESKSPCCHPAMTMRKTDG